MNNIQVILRKFFHDNGRAFGSMGYFLLLMLVFLIGAPEAWMRPNLHQSVFVMMPTLIFLVIPLVFLVASGEIDLSFASTYALAAYVFALLVKAGIDPAIAICVGILSGAIVGALVGALIVFGRLSSLVASLGVLFLLRGLILVLTKSRSITMMDELEAHWVYDVLVGNFYGFPMQVIWATLFVIFCYYLFNKHVFGIHIHHVGDNYVSAEQMGINVKAVKIKAFMFVGLGAGIAGIFTTLITYTFFPTQGFGYLLLALAAVFVGGTPYWGGLGTIIGAVFGVGVIAYMEIGVIAVGMSGTWRQFFNGLIILLALLGHRLHGDRVR
ncbi:MAG: ribose ABC transporter permease [Porticoccaceae bacterium]|nr:ribose ABC transporter permease [Porticoccaceae bacterium]|tara:strand:- start:1 stop:978 length:978 start_codon:yes stop_codon:yes gene_type:complete